MRTVTVDLTWPDGTAAHAVLGAISPDLGAPLVWTGDAGRLASLPVEIAPGRCHVDELLAFAEDHAATTGGAFRWNSEGDYEIGAR